MLGEEELGSWIPPSALAEEDRECCGLKGVKVWNSSDRTASSAKGGSRSARRSGGRRGKSGRNDGSSGRTSCSGLERIDQRNQSEIDSDERT